MRKLLVGVAVVALGVAGSGLSAHAGGAFSNKSFKGSYALVMSGSDVSQNSICSAPPCPVALTGQLTSNGKGTITGGSVNLNDNGVTCSGDFTNGLYSIVRDGTGISQISATTNTSCNNLSAFPLASLGLTITLYNGGKQATLATSGTSPAGLVMSGTASSQNRIP
jgi:hypothetical protein